MTRKMKDSGIEWIGEIPEEWKVEPIKFHLQRNDVKNHPDEKILSVYRDYGVIPKDSRTDNHNVTSQDTSKYKLVMPGELVINKMKAWQGSLAVSKYQGIVSPAYYIYKFINNRLNRNYLNYLIRVCYKDEFRRISGGIREGQWDLSAYDFEHIPILVPSLNEQSCIVSFLNKKIDKINQTSKTIQQEIDALEEYRKSLITETVTKGLDKTVSMKDSGIEWIGEIPENWKVEPVYLHFKERKNKNAKGKEKNLLSLSYGNIIEKDITQLGGLLPSSYTIYNVVEPGDIIIRPTDLQNDKKSFRTGLVTEHGIITSAYIDLMPCNKQSSKFFHYLLHSYDIQKVFYNMGNGVRQGLNFAEFSKLRLLVPGKEEQSKIARFLDQKCFRIAKVITQKQRQLDYFNKYKQSIIYEYVTGKKQVPEKEGIKNAQ